MNRSLLRPAGVNGQLAFGHYLWRPETSTYVGHGVNVVTLRDDRIADVTTFLEPELFARLELPAEIRLR